MASTKQQLMGGEGLTSQIAGMSKTQLYDIMSQMKTLIETNQQQARKILIDNPSLTRSLFQAQIMLGMVRPPQKMPNIQQVLSLQPQQSTQTGQQVNVLASQVPVETGFQNQASSSQSQLPTRQQYATQPSIPMAPPSLPPSNYQARATPQHLPFMQQIKGPVNSHMPSTSFPQTSQVHNLPPAPPVSQHPHLQSHLPMISSQTQHSLQQPSGIMHQPHQPPFPPQPRPHMPPFQNQLHSQIPQNIGYQPSGAPLQFLSQPTYHVRASPGANIPSSFPQGQPQLPNQPLSQHHYLGSARTGSDFSSQGPTPMQVDRGAPWISGLPDSSSTGAQLQGPPLAQMPGQMGPGPDGAPVRPPQLTTEVEKALLQQVMSLTPEQINLLPPEQRQQVFQLQQMLR